MFIARGNLAPCKKVEQFDKYEVQKFEDAVSEQGISKT